MSNTVKVMEVIDVDLTIYKSKPPILGIHAEGIVSSLGYHNGKLIPYDYVQFPPDGIYDFDFVADKPEGQAGDVIAPIAAHYIWPDFPKELKGVRIHAANNKIEKLLSQHKAKELRSSLLAEVQQ